MVGGRALPQARAPGDNRAPRAHALGARRRPPPQLLSREDQEPRLTRRAPTGRWRSSRARSTPSPTATSTSSRAACSVFDEVHDRHPASTRRSSRCSRWRSGWRSSARPTAASRGCSVDTFSGLLVDYARAGGGGGDRARAARDLGLRVRVPDGAHEPPPEPAHRDRVHDAGGELFVPVVAAGEGGLPARRAACATWCRRSSSGGCARSTATPRRRRAAQAAGGGRDEGRRVGGTDLSRRALAPRGLAHGGGGPAGGGAAGGGRDASSTSAWASPTSRRRAHIAAAATARARRRAARATRPAAGIARAARRGRHALPQGLRRRLRAEEVAITDGRQAGAVPRLPGAARPRRRGRDPDAALADVLGGGAPGRRPAGAGATTQEKDGFRVTARIIAQGRHARGRKAVHRQQPLQPHRRRHRSRRAAGHRRHGAAAEVHAALRRHLRAAALRRRRRPPRCRTLRDAVGDRLVVLGTASKSYCMTGWRIGWVLGPEGAGRRLRRARLAQHAVPDRRFAQVGAVEALDRPAGFVRGPGGGVPAPPRLHARRAWPRSPASPACCRPAAFYVFPNVARYLARGVPDDARRWRCGCSTRRGWRWCRARASRAPGYLRISFARPMDELQDGARAHRGVPARALRPRSSRGGRRAPFGPRPPARPVVALPAGPEGEGLGPARLARHRRASSCAASTSPTFDDWMRQEARGDEPLLGLVHALLPDAPVERMERDETLGTAAELRRPLRARGGADGVRGAGCRRRRDARRGRPPPQAG